MPLPLPDPTGRGRYVGYRRRGLVAAAKSLLVWDPHKTAQSDLEGLDFCLFDMKRSGCRIAFDMLSPGQAPPLPVLWIEDRDLWRFRYGDETKYAHAYFASLPMTFDNWDEAMDLGAEWIQKNGRCIRRSIDTDNEKAAGESYGKSWLDAGIVALLNVPYQNASEMAGVLLDKHEDAEFSAAWFMRGDGRIQFSLRSRGDFDVSKVAKAHGGGGHAGAAGFDLSVEEALPMIQQ